MRPLEGYAEDEKREFINQNELREKLHGAIDRGEIVFHPDTESTFAAYETILPGGVTLWVNARDFKGKIFAAGTPINRA